MNTGSSNGTSNRSRVDLHNLKDPRSLATLSSLNSRRERERKERDKLERERRERERMERAGKTTVQRNQSEPSVAGITGQREIQRESESFRQKELEEEERLKQKQIKKEQKALNRESARAQRTRQREMEKEKQTPDLISLLFGFSSFGMSLLAGFGLFFIAGLGLGAAGVFMGYNAKRDGFATRKQKIGMILSVLGIILSAAGAVLAISRNSIWF